MDDPDQVPLALKGEPFGGGAGLDLEAGTLAPVGKAPLQQGDPGVLLDEQLAELSQLDDLVDLVELVGEDRLVDRGLDCSPGVELAAGWSGGRSTRQRGRPRRAPLGERR